MTDEEAQEIIRRAYRSTPGDWGASAANKIMQRLSDHTCAAPIHGMTVDEFKAACCEELVYKNAKLFSRVGTVDAHDLFMVAARVAHRLAQPTPAVDPDKEAKALHEVWRTSGGDGLDLSPWDQLRDHNKDRWRAVAAAKASP